MLLDVLPLVKSVVAVLHTAAASPVSFLFLLLVWRVGGLLCVAFWFKAIDFSVACVACGRGYDDSLGGGCLSPIKR